MTTHQHFEDLEFDLPSALLSQLTDLFDKMPEGPLNAETVQLVPEAQGVYQLFLNGELVYVGKTDAEAGLRDRLLRHSGKIQSRRNLDHQKITFKAVRVFVFTTMDLETLLIKHYKNLDAPLSWNLSGFGSNDPGRERDTSKLKDNHFDKLYPIDLDQQVEIEMAPSSKSLVVSDVLGQMKEKLAYTIRFQNLGGRSRKPHQDLVEATVNLEKLTDSVKNLLGQLKAALGHEWQITAFPGYVIIYKEQKDYEEGKVIEAMA